MSPTRSQFENLKKIERVDVFKNEILAAKLTRTKDGVKFQYEEGYLEEGLPAIATTLPKSLEPLYTKAGGVPAFFAGLLPEGRRLTVLQRKIKTSPDDELSILLAIGTDTVGNVKILPQGETPANVQPLVSVKKNFSEILFEELLASYGEEDVIGVAGVQEKVSARRISMPAARSGERYILKLQTNDYPYVVENEFYFLQLAKKAKMNSADAEIVIDKVGKKALLVKRFDRVSSSKGEITSLAMEDGCQVMGLWPSEKYNVTSESVITALSEKCAAKKLAIRELYRQFCFAWLTGNGDLHAKNVSIIQDLDGEWKVSPSYDIPSTLPYGDIRMALEMAGRNHDLTRRALIEFGTSIGLSNKVSEQVLDEVFDGTEELFTDISDGKFPFDAQVSYDFASAIRRRRFTADKSSNL